jgi:hypothetical protein
MKYTSRRPSRRSGLTETICLVNLARMRDSRRSEPADDAGPDGGGGIKRWVLVAAILIGIAMLGLMIFLHLSGVIGPGVH